jgi:hypothetical protein
MRFGKATAGEIVDVDEHRAAIIPWCLEAAGESVGGVSEAPAAPAEADDRPKRKKARSQE